MKLADLLLEMPLKAMSYHSADEKGSFTPQEKKFIQKYIAQKTYHEKLKNLPIDLYAYVIDAEGLDVFGEEYPESEITADDIKNGRLRVENGNGVEANRKKPAAAPSNERSKYAQLDIDLTKDHFKTVFSQIKNTLKTDPQSVHFILGDNYSMENQMNLTPWMLVHRLLHCWSSEDEASFDGLIDELRVTIGNDAYDLVQEVFTFKSIKKKDSIDWNEMSIEAMTQYAMTGDIKLDLTAINKFGFAKSETTKVKQSLAKFVKMVKAHVNNRMNQAKGKIYYI